MDPRPAGDRGPGPLRLLPATRATACWSACSSRQARRLVAGRRAPRLRVRQAAAGLGADGRRSSAAAMDRDPVPGRRRRAHVLLRPRVVHLRRAPAARPGARAGRLLRGRGPELASASCPAAGSAERVAHWIVDGVPAGRRHRLRARTGRGPRDVAPVPGRARPRSCSACSSATRSGPPGSRGPARDVRRSVLHDRQAAAGAHFGRVGRLGVPGVVLRRARRAARHHPSDYRRQRRLRHRSPEEHTADARSGSVSWT